MVPIFEKCSSKDGITYDGKSFIAIQKPCRRGFIPWCTNTANLPGLKGATGLQRFLKEVDVLELISDDRLKIIQDRDYRRCHYDFESSANAGS